MSPHRLLKVGAVAGPFFIVSSLAQAAGRAGFDPAQNPPSALSLGEAGWIQIVTFVLAGLGFTAGALGLHRTIDGPQGRSAPLFVGIFGLALIAGGLFRMDPAFGYPPGTPNGIGDTVSWHAAIHGVLFPLGFAAILAAGWSLSRRYAAQRRPLRRWTAVAIGPAVLTLSTWPNLGDPQGRFWPLWLGVALAFGWVSLSLADAAPTNTATAPARIHSGIA